MIDMSWGNAEFMYPYWKGKKAEKIDLSGNMPYCPENGLKELKKAILKFHKKHKNIDLSSPYEIVIGNGVTQLLQAAIACLPGKTVGAVTPHFSRFPKLVALTGKTWSENPDIAITTIPNNPNGASYQTRADTIIHDLCYNWPQYTLGSCYKFNTDIQMFSLSKATGHAGSRIGWAFIRDKHLANKMREFIEHQTSGVSTDSQIKAVRILSSELKKKKDCTNFGKQILKQRWALLAKKFEDIQIPQGMFLWLPRSYFKNDVQGIAGSEFGASDYYYRLNIGCSETKWRKFARLYKL